MFYQFPFTNSPLPVLFLQLKQVLLPYIVKRCSCSGTSSPKTLEEFNFFSEHFRKNWNCSTCFYFIFWIKKKITKVLCIFEECISHAGRSHLMTTPKLIMSQVLTRENNILLRELEKGTRRGKQNEKQVGAPCWWGQTTVWSLSVWKDSERRGSL